MACKRSAVRSRLAPPRFALRATRGAATQDRRARRARHSPQGDDGLATPPDIIRYYRVYFLRATRGAATQDRRARRARHSPQGDDGLATPPDIIRYYRVYFPSGYAWRSHARPKGEACPA